MFLYFSVMNKVEQILHKLITENNCVVIPGFGGFLGSFQPASINALHNSLRPPHKTLIFNQNLTLNDGLLLQSICKETGMDFSEASEQLNLFTVGLKNKLNQNQRIELANIGFLFLDEEGQIKFVQNQQYNFLKSSFGLSTLKLNPVNHAVEPISQDSSVFADRKLPVTDSGNLESKQLKSTKRKLNYRLLAALIIAPILGVSLWLSLNGKITNPFQQQANLNPLQDLYTPINYNFGVKETENQSSIADTNGLYQLKITNLPNVNPILVKIQNSIDSTRVDIPEIKKIIEPGFGIIAGCFSNVNNANNLVTQLKSEGFNADNIGAAANGLHRVVFGKYNSKQEAGSALNQIKSKYPNAWISQL